MFFYHGFIKFQGGIGNIAGYFESLGLMSGLAYVVALIELVGGLLLIIGLVALGIYFMFANRSPLSVDSKLVKKAD